VKAPVLFGIGVVIFNVFEALEGVEEALDLFDLGRRDQLGGAPCSEAFEQLALLKDVDHLFLAELADKETSSGDRLDELFLLKDFEGVDQGRPADSHFLSQPVLKNLVSGNKPSFQDHRLQLVIDLGVEVSVGGS